jgi:DNA-binding XRE family transcriptional regulator
MGKKGKQEPLASREAAGHTQKDAAVMIGVSWRTWQEWERGTAPIPPALLELYRHKAGLERIPFRGVDYARPGGA